MEGFCHDKYEFSQASTVGGSTFGFFSISGDLASTKDVNDFPAYTVNSKVIQLHYSYDQAKLNTTEAEWHLIEDKTKKVDSISLEDNILSGTVIIQTSRDGVNWIIIEKLIKKDGFHSLSGTTEEEIQAAEQTLGLTFAKDYRDYLKEFRLASFRGHELTGLINSPRLSVVTQTLEERRNNPHITNDLYVVEAALG